MKKTSMTIWELRSSIPTPSPLIQAFALLSAVCLVVAAANGQTSPEDESRSAPMTIGSDLSLLPDSPVPTAPSRIDDGSDPTRTQAANGSQYATRTRDTGHFDTLIDPREIAPKLSASDKIGWASKPQSPHLP